MIRPRELSRNIALFPAETPTLAPATHTNSYALGSREVLLVEPATPYEGERRAFVEWAEGLRSQGRVLKGILATHHHPDHIGGAKFLSEALSLPLWASDETAARLDASVSVRLHDGDQIALDGPVPLSLQVLITPGHAPGHVCLLDQASGTVVVGDMVASVGTILIARGDGDMGVYLAQLARLRDLGARLALPAHGEPIDDPSKLFAHYIEHRLKRERKVVAALTRLLATSTANVHGGVTLIQLLPEVYDDVSPAIFPIAMLSLETHVDKLVADGRVVCQDGAYALANHGAHA
jgi:glyoxylase-like metal-dependent hydrolase (beta-lactamase superfamily II)